MEQEGAADKELHLWAYRVVAHGLLNDHKTNAKFTFLITGLNLKVLVC